VLARAADMDKTIARVRITAATSEAHPRPRSRTAAQLAGLDRADKAQAATSAAPQAERAQQSVLGIRRMP